MLIEERHGATLVLTLNHPAKRNPLNKTIRDGLLAAFTRAEQDRDIRAIVVTGAGGNFCSGGDIDSMKEVSDLGAGRERFRQTRPTRALDGGWLETLHRRGEGLGCRRGNSARISAAISSLPPKMPGLWQVLVESDWSLTSVFCVPCRCGSAMAGPAISC